MTLKNWFASKYFKLVHGSNLVYNTCWEDPQLDRQALNVGPDDTLAMITSAGCNALDYALLQPRLIHAVDINPRQNALLELKIAGIKALDFETFFAMFGRGMCRKTPELYTAKLRPLLSFRAQRFWDRRIDWFAGRGLRKSFYFHGTSGFLAWTINFYIDWVAKLRDPIQELLECSSIEEQQKFFQQSLKETFWNGFLRWWIGKDSTLALMGVPGPQRRQVEATYPGGIAKFIEDRIEAVFTRIPIRDNYFWRVYLTGSYTPECCPEYLKPDNFARLKEGLVDRIQTHTTPLAEFLERCPYPISRFILLDHMDWLNSHLQPGLIREWQAILQRARPGARVLWRSGGLTVDYVDPIRVEFQGRQRWVGDLLLYHRELADRLHRQDRVHTYGSFYIADLMLS